MRVLIVYDSMSGDFTVATFEENQLEDLAAVKVELSEMATQLDDVTIQDVVVGSYPDLVDHLTQLREDAGLDNDDEPNH